MAMATEDILSNHILPRLPAKSIIRFKCVSKGWHSFLTTSKFANMHLHHQTRNKLLYISNTKSSCTFRTIDCESPEHGLTAPRYLPFDVDTPRHVSFITSCNGLVCVGIHGQGAKKEYSDLFIWNPLTGEYRMLSKINAPRECYRTKKRASLMCFEDDYKLVVVTNSCNVYIYSLKSDLWTRIELTQDFRYSISNHCASLNEKFYLLKEDEEAYSVIALDLKMQTFAEIETPFFKGLGTRCLCFTVVRGCIHVWMGGKHIELWRMDGDGWTKVVTYRTMSVFGCRCTFCQRPVHLMADGNWLMCHKRRLCIIDPENPNKWRFTTRMYTDLDIFLGGKYLETLVSPNQFI